MQDRLTIGIIAPPWVPIPPTAYGGTELVIDALCIGLRDAGHDVRLFTTGDSTCPVKRSSLFRHSDPDRMGATVLELRHVAAAYDALRDVDIIHDHTLAGLLYYGVPDVPVVATNHGPFNEDLVDIFGRASPRIPIIAISHDQASRAPEDLPIAAVIHHGLRLDRYRFSNGPGDHLVFLGRMSHDKGIHTAISAAKATGLPLLIAAKMREPKEFRYFHQFIEPELGDQVQYVGEADFETKIGLLTGARALLNPIRWPEPFGLVMIEAMACGTPVVGYPGGAALEIVDQGVTGFLVSDEEGLVAAIGSLGDIDRRACRRSVEDRFSHDRMAADHLKLYHQVIQNSLMAPQLGRPPTSVESRNHDVAVA